MVVVPPFVGLERQLANRDDRIVVVAKTLLSIITLTPGVVSTYSLVPQNLGFRASTFASLYSRYRILKTSFALAINSSTAAGAPLIYGIQDDNSGEGGAPTPSTNEDVYALRCSTLTALSSPAGGGDNQLYWKPLDMDKFYYTQVNSSSGDARLGVPGTLCAVGQPAAGASLIFQCFYTIEFSGAVETAGQSSASDIDDFVVSSVPSTPQHQLKLVQFPTPRR